MWSLRNKRRNVKFSHDLLQTIFSSFSSVLFCSEVRSGGGDGLMWMRKERCADVRSFIVFFMHGVKYEQIFRCRSLLKTSGGLSRKTGFENCPRCKWWSLKWEMKIKPMTLLLRFIFFPIFVRTFCLLHHLFWKSSDTHFIRWSKYLSSNWLLPTF